MLNQKPDATQAADEEPMVEDDEYDDLYDDVDVGEGFLQMHRSEAPAGAGSVGKGGLQAQKTVAPKLRVQAGASQEMKILGVSVGGNYSTVPEQKVQPPVANVPETQVRHMGFQGSTIIPSNGGVDSLEVTGKFANEPLQSMKSGTTGPSAVARGTNQMNMKVNLNRPMVNDNQIRPPVENGSATLFVGELHWWTTYAELESVLSRYF
ncbi:hypothetical protein ACLB2K_022275 [Fragaria x ananassa]